MTDILFFRSAENLIGFVCKGHTGYDEAGKDILCAAVSSVTQLCSIIADDVLHLEDAVVIDEKESSISVVSATGGTQWFAAVKGLYLFMRQLKEQYPEYLSLAVTDV